MGHSLVGCSLTIGIKRLTASPAAVSSSWGFALAYSFSCFPSPLVEPFISMGPSHVSGPFQRFIRFCAFSLAMLPGLTGSIYALNPLCGLLLAPLLVSALGARPPWPLIRVGISITALSPALVTVLGVSLPSAVGIVLFLTTPLTPFRVAVFELLLTTPPSISPRMDAYAMSVAPVGREGTFAGAAAALVFLAEVPAGLLGGSLLELYCPAEASRCHGQRLFGALATFGAITPALLWSCPALFREVRRRTQRSER
ncbi:MAG: hypothetical protein SGPRY_009070 [Prymnesium sp.]